MQNSDALDRSRLDWINNTGLYGEWTRMWKFQNMEGLSPILSNVRTPTDYPIYKDPGTWKPTISDFNTSVTYCLSRSAWPIIPLSYLCKIPLSEFKYNYFYITFFDLLPATEPNTPLRDLRFIFWPESSRNYFHEIIHFDSDFHPDKNLINLFGSFVYTIHDTPIFSIPSRLAYYVLNYIESIGEKCDLLL